MTDIKQFKLTNDEEIVCEVVEWPSEQEPSMVIRKAMKVISMENYREGATGGKTAAPETAKIYRRIFPIIGITKSYKLGPELLVDNKGELNFVSY